MGSTINKPMTVKWCHEVIPLCLQPSVPSRASACSTQRYQCSSFLDRTIPLFRHRHFSLGFSGSCRCSSSAIAKHLDFSHGNEHLQYERLAASESLGICGQPISSNHATTLSTNATQSTAHTCIGNPIPASLHRWRHASVLPS